MLRDGRDLEFRLSTLDYYCTWTPMRPARTIRYTRVGLTAKRTYRRTISSHW